jgi:hypothetical protein
MGSSERFDEDAGREVRLARMRRNLEELVTALERRQLRPRPRPGLVWLAGAGIVALALVGPGRRRRSGRRR